MDLREARLAARDAVRQLVGPPVGNPEFIAQNADRLIKRRNDAADSHADTAIDAFLLACRERGLKLVGREASDKMHRVGMNLRIMQDHAVAANIGTKDTSEVFAAMWDAAPDIGETL